jgi:hypothetical protein
MLRGPTDSRTTRWLFLRYDGISLAAFQPAVGPSHEAITGLASAHEQAHW